MFTDLEKEAFRIIDEYLNQIISDNGGGWFNTFNMGSAGQLAKKLLDEHKLISYRNPNSSRSISDITPKGLRVIEMGGIMNYLTALDNQLKQREQIQDELLRKELQKINLEIDSLMDTVADYPEMKKRARRSEVIAIIAVVVSILTIVIPFACNRS